MMEILSTWVQNIIYIILFVVFLELLFPDNFMQKYVRMVSGLLIIVVILTPLTQIFSKSFNIEDAISQNYVDMAQIDMKSQQETLQDQQGDLAMEIYKDKITKQIEHHFSKKLEGLSAKVELEIFSDVSEDNYGGIKKVTLHLAEINQAEEGKGGKENIQAIEKIVIGETVEDNQALDGKEQNVIDNKKEQEIKEYFLDFYNVPTENIFINMQENIGEEGEQ